MTFAISWEPSESNAGGFLLFDAVTSWNRSFTGAVSKHPIDGGSNISDHYINNNPTLTFASAQGMKFYFISRSQYKEKTFFHKFYL